MKVILLSQKKFTRVDDDDYEFLKKFKWYARSDKFNYYASRNAIINGKSKTLNMHSVILSIPQGFEVDHIDGDTLNNQKSNLRICNHFENSRNRGVQRNSRSGFKGVFWDSQSKKYKVQIRVFKKRITVGFFDNKIDGAKAYNEEVVKYHGEFAKLNIIPENLQGETT